MFFRVLQVMAFLFLVSVFTAASIHFDFFPGTVFNTASTGLESALKQRKQLGRDFNAGAISPATHKLRGVTHLNHSLVQPGYTLYSSGESQSAKLIDLDGNVVHRWDFSYEDLWTPDDIVQDVVPERFIFVRKARLFPNGDLLVCFSSWGSTPYGYGIIKVDKDSNLIWKDFRHIHHSFDQADDGTIYALDQESVTKAPTRYAKLSTPYLDDGVAVYSADGQFLKRFSLMDTIYNSEYKPLLTKAILLEGKHLLGDTLHANDVEVLGADKAALFPFAKAGDLLISFLKVSGIGIVDPETEQVTWFTTGNWHHQHDADFLDNGNILLFDNIVMKAGADGRPTSRALEFDPKTMEFVWEYRGNVNERFHSDVRSSLSRLQNGNTLITQSHGGRIFEVTSDGEVVWEFYHPVRLGKNDYLVPDVFWAERYAPSDIDFEFSGSGPN